MSKQSNYSEQFRSAGVLPSGPISPWPKGREIRSLASYSNGQADKKSGTPNDMPSVGAMAKGLLKTAGQGLRNGQTTAEIRTERLETCFNCEHYKEKSGRCGLCGCYMKAKSWIGGDPDGLCPAKKWVR